MYCRSVICVLWTIGCKIEIVLCPHHWTFILDSVHPSKNSLMCLSFLSFCRSAVSLFTRYCFLVDLTIAKFIYFISFSYFKGASLVKVYILQRIF